MDDGCTEGTRRGHGVKHVVEDLADKPVSLIADDLGETATKAFSFRRLKGAFKLHCMWY